MAASAYATKKIGKAPPAWLRGRSAFPASMSEETRRREALLPRPCALSAVPCIGARPHARGAPRGAAAARLEGRAAPRPAAAERPREGAALGRMIVVPRGEPRVAEKPRKGDSAGGWKVRCCRGNGSCGRVHAGRQMEMASVE